MLRNGNLKGGILGTAKTEGETFTKNVTDGLRYSKPMLVMKNSMPMEAWSMEGLCEELVEGASFEDHVTFLLRVVVP